MNFKHGLLSAVAILALVGAAAPSWADTTSDLLLRLKEKGILTDEEYQTLLKETQASTAPAPAPQAAAASQLEDQHMVRMTDSGVGMVINGVTLKMTGSVNGFYVHDSGSTPGPTTSVAGGVATVGSQQTSSIRNGLLPGILGFDVSTTQGGIDVAAHFGLYPGINSVNPVSFNANSAGQPTALTTSGIDARQTYMTFGAKAFGTVKIGRDIGLFGSDAILNDITLLGVGTSGNNAGPSNTSLGRIGTGYIYTDFQPQITYTSPTFGGLQASIGVFQPLETIGTAEVNGTPGFQGKLTYDTKAGGLSAHLWLSGLTQHHDTTAFAPAYNGSAFDLGAKVSYGPATVTGYYYDGKGVGTTALFLLSTDAAGATRHSDGFYIQGAYTLDKFTFAGSYGESDLGLAAGEVNPTLVKKNSSYVGQIRYGLTSWVTLLGEFTHTISDAHGGDTASSDTVSTGAILFF